MRTNLYEDLYQTEDVHWWHRAKRAVVRKTVETHLPPHSKLLDIGCGTGKNIESLASQYTVFGVDPAAEARTFCAQRKLQNIYDGTAEALPFDQNTFDGVLFLDVLEHVDDTQALREAYRVLKKDAYLFITVPAYQWLWSGWDAALHHKRRYTKETLVHLLKSEGFAVQKISYFHSFLLVPLMVTRWIKSFFPSPEYASDFQLNNSFINSLLLFMSSLERRIITRYDVPFGTSILCVAQKANQ